MLDAYIYDGLRSPFGRHAGKLAGVRPDDLAAEVIAAVVKKAGLKPERDQRRAARQRQPGRRGLPQRRALRRAAGRPAADHAGRDRQPPVRERPAGHAGRRARDQLRRGRALHRRRRGEHVARALCDRQVRVRLLARRENVRHHHRRALHEPALRQAVSAPTRCRKPATTSPRISACRAHRPTNSRSPRSRNT